jgi:hypothetical protein
LGIGATLHTIVESLEADVMADELRLSVFVTVQAEFAVVGKVSTELKKERPKVAVDRVDV